MTQIQVNQLNESQRETSWFMPDDFHLEVYSFEIDSEDEAMVALNKKRAQLLSRICVLQTAFREWEPELIQKFHQHALSFEVESQCLHLDPTAVVSCGFQALNASLESFQSLFVRESEVISKFQNERYGKIIEELFKRIGFAMNQMTACSQDHRNRIQNLMRLRSEYDEMAADADKMFLKFQARIKDVNADIEDIQANIQRCYDNPQSISIVHRIPFGLDCVASEMKSKSFRAIIEQHKKMFQAKSDQSLTRPQSFYVNSSNDRKVTLDGCKSDADHVIDEAQKLLELYLQALNHPLEAPLKASRDFTEWLRSRLASA